MQGADKSSVAIEAESRISLASVLWALAGCAFAVGTGEFVVAGLLLNIAGDLHVSTSRVGLLVSVYALGVVVGAPLSILLTRRLPRKQALLALMGLFVLGNLLCAVAPSYTMLMGARFITGLAHAAFFGIGSVIAAEVVPSGQRASAIAVMFTGVTLANVLGVPLGTLVGQSLGWRFTFWMVTLLGVAALLTIATLMRHVPQKEAAGSFKELHILRRPQVLMAFAMTTLGMGSVVTVLTYIAPILVKISGFNERAVSPILLLFGLGFVAGNTIGGKLADRRLMASLLGTLVALASVLAAFAVTSHNRLATLVTVFLFGVTAYGMVPGLQMRVVGEGAEAPNLASTFNIAAFNIGSAGGALLGGLVLDSRLGLRAVPWVGALVASASAVVIAWSWFLERRNALSATLERKHT